MESEARSEELGHIQLSEESGPDMHVTELLLLDLKCFAEEVEVIG